MKKADKKRKSRPPGRPFSGDLTINANEILAVGLALTQWVALDDISTVRISSEMGVTPASIRYHLRNRRSLTGGIIVYFYREILSEWPALSGDWKLDITNVSNLVYRVYCKYPGVADHFSPQNKYDTLLLAIEYDEETTASYLERYLSVFMSVGLDANRTIRYAISLLRMIRMSAYSTGAIRAWPAEHKAFSSHLNKLDPKRFPVTALLRNEYLNIDGKVMYETSLQFVLTGLEKERSETKRSVRK